MQNAHSESKIGAKEMGAIRNTLRILSDDHKRLRPHGFISATGLQPTELARILDVSRPTAYRETMPLSPKLMKRIIHLVMATDLAFVLFKNSHEETRLWLMAPNTSLFGESPFGVIMRGDGPEIISWLQERSAEKR